jgi:hypothetical protein
MNICAFVSRIADKFPAQRAGVHLLETSGAAMAVADPGFSITESFDAHDDGTWEYTDYDRQINFDHLGRDE